MHINYVPDQIRSYQIRQAELRERRRQAKRLRTIAALAVGAVATVLAINLAPAEIETYQDNPRMLGGFAPAAHSGLISWPPKSAPRMDVTTYADFYEGRKTADGTTYRHNLPIIASNRHPLGTRLRVIWQGRAIEGTVRDRLAKRNSHRLDLSRSLWDALTGAKPGVARGASVAVIATATQDQEVSE